MRSIYLIIVLVVLAIIAGVILYINSVKEDTGAPADVVTEDDGLEYSILPKSPSPLEELREEINKSLR